MCDCLKIMLFTTKERGVRNANIIDRPRAATA